MTFLLKCIFIYIEKYPPDMSNETLPKNNTKKIEPTHRRSLCNIFFSLGKSCKLFSNKNITF